VASRSRASAMSWARPASITTPRSRASGSTSPDGVRPFNLSTHKFGVTRPRRSGRLDASRPLAPRRGRRSARMRCALRGAKRQPAPRPGWQPLAPSHGDLAPRAPLRSRITHPASERSAQSSR
jgi:hypothetical protein